MVAQQRPGPMAPGPVYTLEEYCDLLELTEASPFRLEYHAGQISLMAGGTKRHGEIATAALLDLAVQLRGSGCRIQGEGVLIQQDSENTAYPDVVVTCDPRDAQGVGATREEQRALYYPCLVVEVLSESTAPFDLGEKGALYRAMPSMRWLLMIDSRGEEQRPLIVWGRTADGTVWERWSDQITAQAFTIPFSDDHALLIDPARWYAGSVL